MYSAARKIESPLDRSQAPVDSPGLLLVGHGTRDPAGQAEFFELTSRIHARLPSIPCQACSLEFAEPNIEQGVARLAEQGVTRVTAMPLLLFAAGHVKQDIPAELAQASARHDGIAVSMSGCLGCHPAVIALSSRRFEEAIAGPFGEIEPTDLASTLLLMVGRGSHDPEANAEMVRFAYLRGQRTPVGRVEVCYMAMAEPSLEQGFDLAARSRFSHIVVQPHLLFRGALVDRVREAVEVRQAMGAQRWTLAEYLGPHDLLVEAVVNIAGF